MMVESAPDAPHDLGMSPGMGVLPQWKRELLQRRAARTPLPPPALPPPLPPSPPADEDEELRYGPGIVKRLKSRYLSLALRDAPRRRPSVLRRATSLEHLLDERSAAPLPFEPTSHPPPAQASQSHPSRPVSEAFLHKYCKTPRRDFVKRARSVDALSRLEVREEPLPPPLKTSPARTIAPAPTPAAASAPVPAPTFAPDPKPESTPTPPTIPAPPPIPIPRSARPPRRPAPLLRDAERPPVDVVRSALRKFENAPPRRAAPAARVSAVLRGLGARTSHLPPRTSLCAPSSPVPPIRSSTPEPCGRSPSPAADDLSAIEDSPRPKAAVRAVSPTALENIARAGCTVRYAFEVPKRGSHLPPVAATNPVLLGRVRNSTTGRRVGVIRPMPAAASPPPIPARRLDITLDANPPVSHTKVEPSPTLENGETLPLPPFPNDARDERKDGPPSAAVEPMPRSPPRPGTPPNVAAEPLLNGHAEPQPHKNSENSEEPSCPVVIEAVVIATTVGACAVVSDGKQSRISAAKIERALNNGTDVGGGYDVGGGGGVWGARRGRGGRPPPAPSSTSVVFDFSSRKEVPDYIENDGVVRRVPRRDRLKASDPGVVALRPGAGGLDSSEDEEAEDEGEEGVDGPPSPCAVRFFNDNVLINGRSSMPTRPNPHRTAKLKLQFDDSLTRTFEYPSESSLCEDASPSTPTPARSPAPAPTQAPAAAPAHSPAPALADNTRIASASLSSYRPSKTAPPAFQLGVTRAQSPPCAPAAAPATDVGHDHDGAASRACAEDARSWSAARAAHTDLLF